MLARFRAEYRRIKEFIYPLKASNLSFSLKLLIKLSFKSIIRDYAQLVNDGY